MCANNVEECYCVREVRLEEVVSTVSQNETRFDKTPSIDLGPNEELGYSEMIGDGPKNVERRVSR